MSSLRKVGLAIASAVVLAGCGGGGGDASKSPQPSPSPAESAGCRSAMSTIGTLAGEMETTTVDDTQQFTQLFDRLEALQRRADKTCSTTVKRSLDLGVSQFARARGGYTACQFGLCDSQKIAREIVAGGQLVRKAVTAAKRTS